MGNIFILITFLFLTSPLSGLDVGVFHPDLFFEEFDFDETEEIALVDDLKLTRNKSLSTKVFSVVLDPYQKTDLYAEVISPVIEITKKNGDRFAKGETLILLDDTIYVSSFSKAQAFNNKAKVELETTIELYNDGLASLYELKEAEAALAESESNLILAEKNLKSTIVSAPYDGKVISVHTKQFELPQKNKELIRIIDDQVLTAKLLLSSDWIENIHIGIPIEIQISETGERVIAYLARIGGMIDPSSSTIEVEAEVENRTEALKAGMSGFARFLTSEEE